MRNTNAVLGRNTNAVLGGIFPLKDIKGKGEALAMLDSVEDEMDKIYQAMVLLRDNFGVRSYSYDGDTINLHIWRACNRNNTAQPHQLRWIWITHEENKKRKVLVLSPLNSVLNNPKQSNAEFLQTFLLQIGQLPLLKQIANIEYERMQLNLRARSYQKIADSIDQMLEIESFKEYMLKNNER